MREYRPDAKQQQQQQALRVQLPQETSIAALSVVNSHHHGGSGSGGSSLQQTHGGSGAAIIQHVPQMQATITPCSTTANDMPREGLVVVQVVFLKFIYLIKCPCNIIRKTWKGI